MQHLPPIPIDKEDALRIHEIYVRAFDKDVPMQRLKDELEGPQESTGLMPLHGPSPGPSTIPGSTTPSESNWDGYEKVLRDNGVRNINLESPSAYIDFTQIHPLFRLEN